MITEAPTPEELAAGGPSSDGCRNAGRDTQKKPMKRSGEIRLHNTHVSVWEEDVDQPAMRRVFRHVLNRLMDRGWQLQRDPRVSPIIADDYRVGTKGNLRIAAETAGRTMSVDLYQEVAFENPNGGRYDFDKFARLSAVSRELRLRCLVDLHAVAMSLLDLGYSLHHDLAGSSLMLAIRDVAEGHLLRRGDPLAAFNQAWDSEWERRRGTHRFKRDETGWPTIEEYGRCWDNRDRDGIPIRNLETRHVRHRGRLMRGVVYTTMNGGWKIDLGGKHVHVGAHELFHCAEPDVQPRRWVPKQKERLHSELEKALKVSDYRRVGILSRVCQEAAAGETTGGAT